MSCSCVDVASFSWLMLVVRRRLLLLVASADVLDLALAMSDPEAGEFSGGRVVVSRVVPFVAYGDRERA